MNKEPLPAMVYCDIACELYPNLASRIKEEVAVFYADQAGKCGEHLVKMGIVTPEQNRLILLSQKAKKTKLDKADIEELFTLQSTIHYRTLTSIETMGIIIQGIRKQMVCK